MDDERIKLKFEAEIPAENAEDAEDGAAEGTGADGEGKAKAPGGLRSNPLSHKLYERLGLTPSLKAVNIFIGIIVVLLIIALIIGVAT